MRERSLQGRSLQEHYFNLPAIGLVPEGFWPAWIAFGRSNFSPRFLRKFVDRIVARPLSLLAGHAGYVSEKTVYAVKPSASLIFYYI